MQILKVIPELNDKCRRRIKQDKVYNEQELHNLSETTRRTNRGKLLF